MGTTQTAVHLLGAMEARWKKSVLSPLNKKKKKNIKYTQCITLLKFKLEISQYGVYSVLLSIAHQIPKKKYSSSKNKLIVKCSTMNDPDFRWFFLRLKIWLPERPISQISFSFFALNRQLISWQVNPMRRQRISFFREFKCSIRVQKDPFN